MRIPSAIDASQCACHSTTPARTQRVIGLPAAIGGSPGFVSLQVVVDDRTARLESAVAQLQLTVLSLHQRLEAIEARGLGAACTAADRVAAGPPENAASAQTARARAKDSHGPLAIL